MRCQAVFLLLLSACAAPIEGPADPAPAFLTGDDAGANLDGDGGCTGPGSIVLEFDRTDSCTVHIPLLDRSIEAPEVELWGWHKLGKNCPPVAYKLTKEKSPQDDGFEQVGAYLRLRPSTCEMAMTGRPYFKFEVRLTE